MGSSCPLALSLDLLGDKWSLIILRDILLGGKSHFRELLTSSEKISTNILSARLETLTSDGFLTKHNDNTNKSAVIYKPTQKALDLLPVLFAFMEWGVRYTAADATIPGVQMILTQPDTVKQMVVQKFA